MVVVGGMFYKKKRDTLEIRKATGDFSRRMIV
jgi:hypothetical protein